MRKSRSNPLGRKLRHLRVFALVCCLSLLANAAWAVSLPDAGIFLPVENMVVVPDPEGKYDLAGFKAYLQAIPASNSGDLHLPSRAIDDYWLYFELTNEDQDSREILLSFHRWYLVEVYSERDSTRYPVQKTGFSVPYAKRDFTYNSALCVKMRLLPAETRKVFVHLNKHPNIGMRPQDLSVIVSDFKTGLVSLRRMETISVILLALLCFIMLYNVFFFIALKEKRYRFYLLSVLLVALELARWAGFWSHILGDWEGTAAYEWNLLIVQNILLGTSWTLLARDFLNLKTYSPRLERLLLMGIPAFVLCWLFIKYEPYFGQIFGGIMGVLAGIVFMYVTWFSYRKGQPLVGYFLVSVLVVTFFSTLNVVNVVGWATGLQTVSLPWRSIGSLIFDTILSFALGRQFFGMKKDNQEKQEMIIENLQKKNLLQNLLNRATLLYQERTHKEIARRLQAEVVHLLEGVRTRLSPWAQQDTDIIAGSSSLIAQTLGLVDSISQNLMPESGQDPESLTKAIAQILRSVTAALEVKFSYSHPQEIPEDIRILVCRIVKEVYTNTLKHAEAKSLEVEILHEHPGIVLIFRDNGVGFDPSLENEGQGLRITRQKLSIYGGDIHIESAPGKGTSIRVELPLVHEAVV